MEKCSSGIHNTSRATRLARVWRDGLKAYMSDDVTRYVIDPQIRLESKQYWEVEVFLLSRKYHCSAVVGVLYLCFGLGSA